MLISSPTRSEDQQKQFDPVEDAENEIHLSKNYKGFARFNNLFSKCLKFKTYNLVDFSRGACLWGLYENHWNIRWYRCWKILNNLIAENKRTSLLIVFITYKMPSNKNLGNMHLTNLHKCHYLCIYHCTGSSKYKNQGTYVHKQTSSYTFLHIYIFFKK